MLFLWLIIFIFSAFVLIKGSSFLISGAEKISHTLKISPFLIGVFVVGVGVSLPELSYSLMAVKNGFNNLPIAVVLGSNIINILLILGISGIIARKIIIDKKIIDLDLSMLLFVTIIFLILIFDGKIDFIESVISLIIFAGYIFFSFFKNKREISLNFQKIKHDKISFLKVFLGFTLIIFGSSYLIDSVFAISKILNISGSLITVSFVALTLALPDLIVSIRAAQRRQSEIIIGNIFTSNIFNVLFVLGLTGLFSNLILDTRILIWGVIFMFISSIVFVVSAISRRIFIQESFLFLILYLVFIAKLFNLF